MQGAKHLGDLLLLFQAHWQGAQGADSEMEQFELKPGLIWDAGTMGGGFILCATEDILLLILKNID